MRWRTDALWLPGVSGEGGIVIQPEVHLGAPRPPTPPVEFSILVYLSEIPFCRVARSSSIVQRTGLRDLFVTFCRLVLASRPCWFLTPPLNSHPRRRPFPLYEPVRCHRKIIFRQKIKTGPDRWLAEILYEYSVVRVSSEPYRFSVFVYGPRFPQFIPDRYYCFPLRY